MPGEFADNKGSNVVVPAPRRDVIDVYPRLRRLLEENTDAKSYYQVANNGNSGFGRAGEVSRLDVPDFVSNVLPLDDTFLNSAYSIYEL